jgi:hypothetical protein
MDIAQLSKLILYIVHQVGDLGGYVTTIRLVKFLYLIDLEHYRRYGRILTGLNWQFHLYGPYAFELPEIGRRLGFNLEREEFVTAIGRHGTIFRVPEPQDFPTSLSFGAETVVNGILKVWADQETDNLLYYVYHRTEPLLSGHRGRPLDFSHVERSTHYYELGFAIDEIKKKGLLASIQSYSQEDLAEFTLLPTRRGSILEEGLRAVLSDERQPAYFAGITSTISLNELWATLPPEE